MSQKGSQFEREICGMLSLWWTDGERDDIFWRTFGSGGRAKRRGRAGKQTAGAHGDITATDPIGVPLTSVFTVEIKRGYSSYTLQDLLDRPDGSAQQMWETWLQQVIESHEQAKSVSWVLIVQRDRREPIVFMPFGIGGLFDQGFWRLVHPFFTANFSMISRKNTGKKRLTASVRRIRIMGTTLAEWFRVVRPNRVKMLAKSHLKRT